MAVKTAARPAVRTLDEAITFMTESIAEMSREIKKSTAETRREIKESNERTDRRIAESNERTDRLIAESREQTDRLIKESNERTDRLIALRIDADRADMKKIMDRLSDDMGHLGNKLGHLVELIVVPGMRREMDAQGHVFSESFANRKVYGVASGEKRRVAEVDLFLNSDTEAMAAEIKTSLSVEDVNNHINQLKILRKYEDGAGIRDKTLYGAVVGVYIDKRARKLALKSGLYVLEILELEERLKADIPERPRAW